MTDRDCMRLALEEARAAFLEDEVPVGAVLIRDGIILARAHNRMEALRDPTAHAEMLAIRAALADGPIAGATLYATLEPCAMCTGAALHARIGRIVFGAFDPRAGCCGSLLDLADHCLPESARAEGGLLEEECAALLKDFFLAKRR